MRLRTEGGGGNRYLRRLRGKLKEGWKKSSRSLDGKVKKGRRKVRRLKGKSKNLRRKSLEDFGQRSRRLRGMSKTLQEDFKKV